MTVANIASLAVSIVSAGIAAAAFLFARLDPKPRIRGQINAVLHSPLNLPDGREITALMLHVTLTNSTMHPVHVMRYRLDIDRGHGREVASRLKRVYSFPSLRRGDQRIVLDENVLIYRPPRPVEYGAPLVGLIVFYIEERDVLATAVKSYQLVVTDVFGHEYQVPYRLAAPSDDGFDSVELFELAGARIEQIDSTPTAGARRPAKRGAH